MVIIAQCVHIVLLVLQTCLIMIDMTSYKAETRLRGMVWSKVVMSQVSKNQTFG